MKLMRRNLGKCGVCLTFPALSVLFLLRSFSDIPFYFCNKARNLSTVVFASLLLWRISKQCVKWKQKCHSNCVRPRSSHSPLALPSAWHTGINQQDRNSSFQWARQTGNCHLCSSYSAWHLCTNTQSCTNTQCALQPLCFTLYFLIFTITHPRDKNKQECKQNRTPESSNIKSQLTCCVFFVDLSLHTLVNIYICWCIHLSVTIPIPVNTCTFQYIQLSVHTPVTVSTPFQYTHLSVHTHVCHNTYNCQYIHLCTYKLPVSLHPIYHTEK